MNTLEFNIRGQICPSSLLTALREINTHQEALHDRVVRLRFLTDNRDCVTTIPNPSGIWATPPRSGASRAAT